MSDGNNSRSGGLTFFGALQVLFIGLKLTGCIDWPWAVVLAPIIIEVVLVVVIVLFVLATYDL